MGITVGAVEFDLIIRDTMQRQLENIAAKASKSAGATMEGAGKAIGRALTRPLEQAGQQAAKAIADPVKKAVADVERLANGAVTIVHKQEPAKLSSDGALHEPVPIDYKAIRDSQAQIQAQMDSEAEKLDKIKSKAAELATVELDHPFRAAEDSVERLQQKLENATAKLHVQQIEADRLRAAYEQLPAEEQGKSVRGVEALGKLTNAEGKLLSIRDQIQKLEAQIDKAESKASGAAEQAGQKAVGALDRVKAASSAAGNAVKNGAGKALSGLVSAAKRAGTGAKNALSKGFQAAKRSVQGHIQGMQQRVTKLSRSIKSAFKSVFLMAGLYAAFRGVKELLQSTALQNEQFAQSLQLIKGNLQVAFTPIVQAVMPALNTLAAGLAAVSHRVAETMAALFGSTYTQALVATKQVQAVSKQVKQANNTMSIDELNIASDDVSGEEENDLDALDTAQYEPVLGFGDRIKDMLTKAAAAVGPGISKILKTIEQAAPRFVKAAAGIVKEFLSGITANFPAITESAVSILQTLLHGMWDVLPEVGPFVTELITFLATAFLTYAPQLFSMGAQLFADVLSGLESKIPALIPQAQTAIWTLVNALRDNLPRILQSGINILLELVHGIAEELPALVPAALQIVLDLVEGIIANLDELVDGAVALVTGLADGIIDALPILVERAPKIIEELVTGLVDAIPKLAGAALDIIRGLKDYLLEPGNISKIISAAGSICGSIASGLIDAIWKLGEAAGDLVGEIIDTIIHTDWIQVGKDIIDGIWTGLKNYGSKIWDTVTGWFGGGNDTPEVTVETSGSGKGHSSNDAYRGRKMASGGLVRTPTLALIGEYSGARSNPEVVAPLNTLRDILGDTSTSDPQVPELLDRILDAILGLDLNVVLRTDDRTIASASRRGTQGMGYPILATT